MANGNNQGFIHSLQRVRRWICGEPDNEPLIKRHWALGHRDKEHICNKPATGEIINIEALYLLYRCPVMIKPTPQSS